MAKYLDYTGLSAVVNYLTPQAGSGISITKNSDKQNVISCTLDTTVFKIVTSLPTSDIDTNVIYVVTGTTTGSGDNLYSEYIYVDGNWEKLGEFKADTDLSNYYTKSEVDSLISTDLSSYYTKSEVDELIAAAQLAIDNEEAEIQEIFSTMLTKSEAASTYQEILSAGDGISLSNNTISTNVTATATGDSNLTLTATSTGSAITITGSVDLSDYVTSSDLTNNLGNYLTSSEAASTYQKILSAGDNITISNNVISAVDTTYTAGDNVAISSSNVISVNLSDYLTTSAAASTYQEKLTAGTLINITNNTISADLEAITTDEIDELFQ